MPVSLVPSYYRPTSMNMYCSNTEHGNTLVGREYGTGDYEQPTIIESDT